MRYNLIATTSRLIRETANSSTSIERPETKAGHFTVSIVKIKNSWIFNSRPAHVYQARG